MCHHRPVVCGRGWVGQCGVENSSDKTPFLNETQLKPTSVFIEDVKDTSVREESQPACVL